MDKSICIIGGGLAGSECALTLADLGFKVHLYEMRPNVETLVHRTECFAELVCSNSLKSMKVDSASGMLKEELRELGSKLFKVALENRIAAGGALAVDRERFSDEVTKLVCNHPCIEVIRKEAKSISDLSQIYDVVILATGPLTSDALAECILDITNTEDMAFYDAAAPIVMADSLDMDKLFLQNRYEEADGEHAGDYLNAFMDKEEYDSFIEQLIGANRVMLKSFENKDLFQACQPIEEIARKGWDAPRFGALKPVGLKDPVTGKRPWAAVQLRAENANKTCYNLVGFQTNLTFSDQQRVFRMIPGLENAEFARYGVMHRNTYMNAPKLLDSSNRLIGGSAKDIECPIYVAGQLSGTEGYCEAIRSGLHVAFSVAAHLRSLSVPQVPKTTAYGALCAYYSDPLTKDYQPMHVNFGIMPPLENEVRNKRERYSAYSERGNKALKIYAEQLRESGLLK